MELVLFIGLPATGKSTFYCERFYRTHVRINLDMLRTRHREDLLFQACVAGQTRMVVDNTNLTCGDRARYIAPARAAGFSVQGYFFESRVAAAQERNAARPAVERVPPLAIAGGSRRMELPSLGESFDRLYFVQLAPGADFVVKDWQHEI